jgi:cobalamin biosynthesis Mg chelatase CobN
LAASASPYAAWTARRPSYTSPTCAVPVAGKVEGADQFLAKELATRNFHPGYIKGLMAEGYAGTLQVLDSMNNFSGWTIVAREIVRDDQWPGIRRRLCARQAQAGHQGMVRGEKTRRRWRRPSSA